MDFLRHLPALPAASALLSTANPLLKAAGLATAATFVGGAIKMHPKNSDKPFFKRLLASVVLGTVNTGVTLGLKEGLNRGVKHLFGNKALQINTPLNVALGAIGIITVIYFFSGKSPQPNNPNSDGAYLAAAIHAQDPEEPATLYAGGGDDNIDQPESPSATNGSITFGERARNAATPIVTVYKRVRDNVIDTFEDVRNNVGDTFEDVKGTPARAKKEVADAFNQAHSAASDALGSVRKKLTFANARDTQNPDSDNDSLPKYLDNEEHVTDSSYAAFGDDGEYQGM